MNWQSIQSTLATVAPVLGTLIAGPTGTMVGGLVATALGVSPTPQAVTTALLDPEKQLQLQKWVMDNKVKLTELAVEQAKAELADIQHARTTNKYSRMPAMITAAMTLLATVYGVGLFYVNIPIDNRDMVNFFGGQLVTLWVASVVYWVGTTRSSAEKNSWMKTNSLTK